MNDLVSIIMPSFNTAEYIDETIRSVLYQTYTNWELIIVDDCSTDNTDEVVEQFKSDSRIHYLKNDVNSGAAVSRNRALREARGKWIAFLDSDDLWSKHKLEYQIRFMEEIGCHFSYTMYEEMDSVGSPTGVRVTGPKRINHASMVRYCWPGCLTVIYDKERVGLLQIADIKKNNDYAMWLKVSKKADCFLCPIVLARYRRGRNGSVSTQSVTTMVGWHYRLFRDVENENSLWATIHTGQNLFFGVIKKLLYVKKNSI